MSASLHDARYVLMRSFRRDGTAVATPFGPMHRDGKIYCYTNARSGKVKRIRRDTRVEVATCTQRGQITGPIVEGRARLLSGAERAAQAKAFDELWLKQFGLMWRIGRAIERLRGVERAVIEITPTGT